MNDKATDKLIQLDEAMCERLLNTDSRLFDFVRLLFPKLRIIARGNTLKLIGSADDMAFFEAKLRQMTSHVHTFGALDENAVMQIMESSSQAGDASVTDALLFTPTGMAVKARTCGQRRLVNAVRRNDMVFAIGPAGTGKTYTAVALAVAALKSKSVKRIVLTRPAVEAGEQLGFLPGDLRDKLDPYLQPLYDALRDMLPSQKLQNYLDDAIIEIAPLAFMRGRTLSDAFVILDEAQNATSAQLKMFLTRMGRNAKFIITGDITQVDLPRNQRSGLKHATTLLGSVDGIEVVELDATDVVRHRLVSSIISVYEADEQEQLAIQQRKREERKLQSEYNTTHHDDHTSELQD